MLSELHVSIKRAIMRTERNRDQSYTVWLSREEYERLPRATSGYVQEIVPRLMGDCGRRVAEGRIEEVIPLAAAFAAQDKGSAGDSISLQDGPTRRDAQ